MLVDLLVRVVDKVNLKDARKNLQLAKRGHVIVAKPAGWRWSKKERQNSDWRIIRVDLPVSKIRALLAPDRVGLPGQHLVKLDLNALAIDKRATFDGLRTLGIIKTITEPDLDAIWRQKVV